MTLEIMLGGRTRRVELTIDQKHLYGSIDGRAVQADAVQVVPGVYSLIISGRSFEVRVEPKATDLNIYVNGREYLAKIQDPRQRQRHRGSTAEVEGRQKIVSPMPGKIIRLLVATGDVVEAGQGLFVVEAMKMQNEVRSPKSGTVEQLLVSEGQTVNAGEALGFIA